MEHLGHDEKKWSKELHVHFVVASDDVAHCLVRLFGLDISDCDDADPTMDACSFVAARTYSPSLKKYNLRGYVRNPIFGSRVGAMFVCPSPTIATMRANSMII